MTFVLKLARLTCYLLNFHIRPNLRSNFCYYRRQECFKINLRILKVSGSWGGASEILTMISVQKCQFLAISGDWTNVYACCSFKLIINNECLVYFHSLDFALIIYVTKIRQFHVSQLWHGTGPISPFVVLALWFTCGPFVSFLLTVQISGAPLFPQDVRQDLHLLPTCGIHVRDAQIFWKVTNLTLFLCQQDIRA